MRLKKDSKLIEAGGDLYLIQLTQKISSTAHLDYHSRIIMQKYIQRKCITVSSEVIENSYDEDFDVFELLEKVFKSFGGINDLINVGQVIDFKESVLNYIKNQENQGEGIKSSFYRLNKTINGYFNTDLIILAARPGMGKTAFVLNEILHMAFNGVPVSFFSLEMSIVQIIGRLLSIISGIDSQKIRNTSLLTKEEKDHLKICVEILSKLPIHIDDSSGLSPIELKLKISKLKIENKTRIAFVDYLQLMKVKDRKVNREQEISIISSSLKAIAKEYDIPVIALSQLSRDVEKRGSSKRPLLSDLRDSGSIEQDADMVLFLYRPEYYKIEEWDDDERMPTLNSAEIDIAKFRNGETGYVRVGCDLKYMRFYDEGMSLNEIEQRYLYDPTKEKGVYKIPKINPSDAFEENDIPF